MIIRDTSRALLILSHQIVVTYRSYLIEYVKCYNWIKPGKHFRQGIRIGLSLNKIICVTNMQLRSKSNAAGAKFPVCRCICQLSMCSTGYNGQQPLIARGKKAENRRLLVSQLAQADDFPARQKLRRPGFR
jgi:hypothetical protein